MSATSTGHSNRGTIVSSRNVLILAVAPRVLLPLLAVMITAGDPLFEARDTNSYIQPAVALLTEGRFARWREPELIRTPGYPLLLIPGIVLGQVELVTIALQIALSVLTVFLVYRITLLLFERAEIAILSALLYAIEPVSILYASKLMSETLFTALFTVFLYLLLRYWKERALSHLVLSAMALASATYVRPITYYLPILVSIVLLAWVLATGRKNSRRLVHLGIFLLTSMGLIGIWQIRNKLETGYSGFSAAAEHSLYFWDAASVLAVVEGIPVDEMRDQMGLYDQERYYLSHPDQRGWRRSDIFTSMGKEGLKIIRDHVDTYSVLVAKGSFRTVLDPGAIEYLREFRLYPESGGLLGLITDQGLAPTVGYLFEEAPVVFWTNVLLGLLLVAYLLCAILGIVQSRIMFSMPMILISVLTVYLLVLSAAGIGTHRARHPIMPMICVLAGNGMFWIAGAVKGKRARRRPGVAGTGSDLTE